MSVFTTTESVDEIGRDIDDDPGDPAKQFIINNLWVPIVGSVVVMFVFMGVAYGAIRYRRRMRQRYDYWALDSTSLPSRVDLEHRMDTVLYRDSALLSCSFYLRSCKEYKLVDHLTEIGNRERKQWFLLYHKNSRTEKLLSIMPCSAGMVQQLTKTTLRAFREICQHLEHPYVLPIEEIALQGDQGHVITIQPCCQNGSLKDYIYSSRWVEHYGDKYNMKTSGLDLVEVKTFARQILEAMLYFKDKGFPWHGHLHTGNVFVVNGVCRLSGYENTLLGLSSKIKPLLKRSAQQDTKLLDVHSFGHVMFEMLLGEELRAAAPDANHYRTVNNSLIVEFLSCIFTRHNGEYPSLKKISKHQFLQGVWLSELSMSPLSRSPLPQHLKTVLKAIKKGSTSTKRNKSRGQMSRASSHGSINSQASSGPSHHCNASESTPLLSFSVSPIPGGSGVNQAEITAQPKIHKSRKGLTSTPSKNKYTGQNKTVPAIKPKSYKSKKRDKSYSLQDFSVAIAEGEQSHELQLRRQTINGDRSALMNDIRRGVVLRHTSNVDTSEPAVC